MAYKSKIEEPAISRFFEAILMLENKEDCYRFFEDVATVAEVKALAQRFEVAQMLVSDETYSYIADTTGASTATISRVKRSLNYGSDGYKLMINRLNGK